MAGMTVDRRQRWAAFSVRAHRDIGSLASDVLLYHRIILPVPEDDPEYERWVRSGWDPDAIALRTVQAAGVIIPVPWTAQLTSGVAKLVGPASATWAGGCFRAHREDLRCVSGCME